PLLNHPRVEQLQVECKSFILYFFLFMLTRPPRYTLFPYTTLFRTCLLKLIKEKVFHRHPKKLLPSRRDDLHYSENNSFLPLPVPLAAASALTPARPLPRASCSATICPDCSGYRRRLRACDPHSCL